MNRVKRPATNRWTDNHIQLAHAAVTVRESLRRLLPTLDHNQRQVVGAACDELTRALKARNDRRAA
jgi:hypothetical protein